MFDFLKKLYHKPTALEEAARELEEAKLAALQEHSMAEYRAAQSDQHEAMVAYNKNRINRLTAYLQEVNK